MFVREQICNFITLRLTVMNNSLWLIFLFLFNFFMESVQELIYLTIRFNLCGSLVYFMLIWSTVLQRSLSVSFFLFAYLTHLSLRIFDVHSFYLFIYFSQPHIKATLISIKMSALATPAKIVHWSIITFRTIFN